MMVENLIVLLAVIGLGYIVLRLLYVIIQRLAATKGLGQAPFLIAALLIVVLLSIIMFSSEGGKGLFLGWTYLICFSISLYFANVIYRKIVAKAFNTLSEKIGNTFQTRQLMLLCEFIGWVSAALCFAVIGTTFIAIAKMLGMVD